VEGLLSSALNDEWVFEMGIKERCQREEKIVVEKWIKGSNRQSNETYKNPYL
jgi:hypothetical protein